MNLDILFLTLFSLVIFVFGAGMAWRQHVSWKKQQGDWSLEAGERRHLHFQYRRRMQINAMIALLGLMLNGFNEFIIPWQRAPLTFMVFVLLIFVLLMWIVLLAMADWFANRVVYQTALHRLEKQREHLSRKVNEQTPPEA